MRFINCIALITSTVYLLQGVNIFVSQRKLANGFFFRFEVFTLFLTHEWKVAVNLQQRIPIALNNLSHFTVVFLTLFSLLGCVGLRGNNRFIVSLNYCVSKNRIPGVIIDIQGNLLSVRMCVKQHIKLITKHMRIVAYFSRCRFFQVKKLARNKLRFWQ